jgi:hypothetical protein
MPTKRQIAIIAGIVFGIPMIFWLSRPHYDIAGYGFIAVTVAVVVVAVCWELHKMRERRKLWQKMVFPSQVELGSIPAAPMRPADAGIRAEYGYPPKIDDFFGDVIPVGAGDWTYQIWLEEWAELYLGGEYFATLERRFAATPGVSCVLHEDREVFLIKTEKLTPQEIRAAFWQHFLEVAKEGLSK